MLYWGLAIGVMVGSCMVVICLALYMDYTRSRAGVQRENEFGLPIPSAVVVGVNDQRLGSMNSGHLSCHSAGEYYSGYRDGQDYPGL